MKYRTTILSPSCGHQHNRADTLHRIEGKNPVYQLREDMNLKIISFGIAKEIIGSKQMNITVERVHSAGELKLELTKRFPEFEKLVNFSLAVNEEYQDDNFELSDGDEVVVIPPVSGG